MGVELRRIRERIIRKSDRRPLHTCEKVKWKRQESYVAHNITIARASELNANWHGP